VNVASLLGALIALAGLFLPWVETQSQVLGPNLIDVAAWAWIPLLALIVLGLIGSWSRAPVVAAIGLILGLSGALLALVAVKSALATGYTGSASLGFWFVFLGELLGAAGMVNCLTTLSGADRVTYVLREVVPPLVVPAFLLLLWQGIVEGLRVPIAFFPSVTDVVRVLFSAHAVLVDDSIHTFIRQMLFGYILGAAMGVLTGMMIALSPFLRRGFLPLATAVSSIPVIGLAPVLGRAFGVDWESKAAVASIVTFFPVVINMVQGLMTADPRKMDLLHSYAARRGQIFRKLRFPHALPYLFNALKITSIISLISVIVAEFLIPGPPEGLGQRISLSARSGRYDITFAAIAFASTLGILFYGFIALLERVFTAWHSSFRGAQRR
ncbi:ABC transporter permease, partial [Candidatus Acetothermia bacterium]|nr:ABC transporter permease [Candidatus Acetothermia bacterium]